jgi:hypothetical protein
MIGDVGQILEDLLARLGDRGRDGEGVHAAKFYAAVYAAALWSVIRRV